MDNAIQYILTIMDNDKLTIHNTNHYDQYNKIHDKLTN